MERLPFLQRELSLICTRQANVPLALELSLGVKRSIAEAKTLMTKVVIGNCNH